jgi:hypothetical protein
MRSVQVHNVFVTPNGSRIVGKDWPRMNHLLARDDNELSPSGERDGQQDQRELAELRAHLKRLSLRAGENEAEHQARLDRVLERHEKQSQSDRAGAANATDKRRARDAGPLDGHGVPGDEDEDEDDDGFAERVRAYLSGKGLDPKSIEDAIQIAVRNRAAGVDERPNNAIGNGPPIKNRISDEDFQREYPGSETVSYDPMGELDRMRNAPRDPVKALSERAVSKVAGGGTGRRLATPAGASDAGLVGDEDIEQQIEREYGRGPGVGMFGSGR